jgi:flagellar protein FlbD
MVNCELIEFVDERPNSIVSMASGRKVVVKETCDEIRDMVIAYKREIYGEDILQREKDNE